MPQQHPEPQPETVRILALEDSDDRSLPRRPAEWRLGRTEVPVDAFRDRVTAFLESMRHVLVSLPAEFGRYELDQVTISAEVSAKGQVSLLGSGGELAGSAGITFEFTRRPGDLPRPANTFDSRNL